MMTREQYLFLKLMEEASEVAQISSKIMQFGVNERHPDMAEDNEDRLRSELMDMVAVVAFLFHEGYIKDFTDKEIFEHTKHRAEKMKKYYDYSESLGKVEPCEK